MNIILNNRVAKLIFVIAIVFMVVAVVSGYMIQTIMVPSVFVLKGLHTIGWNSALEQLFHTTVALGKWNDRTFDTSFIRENVRVSVDQEEERIIRLLTTDIIGPFNWRLFTFGEAVGIPFPPPPRPPLSLP